MKLLGAIATAIGAVAAMAGGSKLGGGDSQASSAPPGAGVPPPERATQSSVPERGPLSETRAVSQLRPAPAAFSMNAKSTPGYPLAADPRYPICIDTDSGRVVFCEDNFVFSVQDQCRTGTNIEGIRDLLSLGERHPDAVSRLSDKLRACYLDLFNHVRPHERSMKDALREAREKAEGDPTLEVVLHDARDLSSSIVYIGNSRGRKVGEAAPPDVLTWITENAASCKEGECKIVGVIEEARRADGRLVTSIEKKYNSQAYLYYEDGAIVWIRCENRTPMAARP